MIDFKNTISLNLIVSTKCKSNYLKMMPLRSNRRTKTPLRRSTPLLLSDIHSLSTYITLKIPYSIAYSNYKPQLDPHQNKRTNRKTERQKSDRRQCERYWLSEYATKSTSTKGQAIMHCAARQYLQIDQKNLV